MDVEYRILNLFKTKQYDDCLKLCANALQYKDDRMIDFIRMRSMTIQAKVAGNGYDEVSYFPNQDELTATAVAKTPRPGTSFQQKTKTTTNPSEITKKRVTATAVSRSRLATTTIRTRSARTALHTASRLSRAATAVAGNSIIPGMPVTLRFLEKDDKLFIPASKTLFEYIYYCEGNIRKAMDVAFQAQKADNTVSWWWNFSLARCYSVLGMYRNTEECLRQALRQNKHVSIYLRLIAMYVGMNQPLTALDVCKQGLSYFHDYAPLLIEQARIHEEMDLSALAVKEYRMVAIEDPSNMEAVAYIAMFNFYNDQPEIALRYYRRLLATQSPGAEIYNNLGLCCLYCNQWDLTIPCFRQSLYFSTDPETRSNIWYNLAHVALSTGDIILARRCLQVSLATNSGNNASVHALHALNKILHCRNTLNSENVNAHK
ncbi:tetratricopeptide repeat protein 8 isoform X1 [Bombyx mori]|uniref:Tetratricopeptide repeat protein 8 n=1 Tax=Bombyx mori TaxID=7091 RepID=A0A8R2DK38_BOMMO|nr:tetratricopeptide repeat protein 8 isoform X1 [Bombyx mori]